MPTAKPRSLLSGMLVKQAMRRQVVQLPAATAIAKGINHLLKFKVSVLLVTDGALRPVGVVSKTDLIGAYYAGLPVETALGEVMVGPPRTCFPDDPLETALDRMRRHNVHRLHVTGAASPPAWPKPFPTPMRWPCSTATAGPAPRALHAKTLRPRRVGRSCLCG
jgi:CBS-domain-containing membrane protein